MVVMFDALLADKIALNALLYLSGSLAGAVAHWTTKWLNDEVACVFDMARTERKRTFAAVAAQVSAAGVVVATGAIDAVAPGAAFLSGVFQGGAIDAFVNKGKRPVWTEEKREQKQK
jgi:hypothetical protein